VVLTARIRQLNAVVGGLAKVRVHGLLVLSGMAAVLLLLEATDQVLVVVCRRIVLLRLAWPVGNCGRGVMVVVVLVVVMVRIGLAYGVMAVKGIG
jgi:hypothetical protein